MELFGISTYGKSLNVTAQQRINCYIEKQPGDDRSEFAIYGTGGTTLFGTTFGDTPIRGLHQKGNFLYVVHRGTLYSVNNAGVKTALGSISSTTGRVYMADNGVQLMLVDGLAGYIYNFNTTVFSQIVSAGFPALPKTVTWSDGYFIVNPTGTQRFYISALYDGLTWSALDFASAESNPDDLILVSSDNSTLYLFGSVTTEFFNNSGAADFPFTRLSGGSTEWGCAAVNSVVKFDNSLAFVAKNRMGQVIVARMNGYLPQKISTPEIEYIINNYSTTADCTAISYMLGGHPMLQLNFPTGDASFLYDGLSQAWSILKSYNINRHIAEIGINYLDKTIMSDYAIGNLYFLDSNSYLDNGNPIAMEITGRHLNKENNRFSISRLQLNIEAGVGTATGASVNPQIQLFVSKDGGHTYSGERFCNMGALGKYITKAVWRSLGRSRDFTFKFRITDNVKRVIFGSSLDIHP